ncbi:MAG: biotin--[acetyl-CoA-carboxylase] ligase [Lautropia sp.]|nr:biotin--[acetyl-CoA-carboxylase] ligase [Lautropia sp.]
MQNDHHSWVRQIGRLRVEWVASTDSTNLELMRRPTLVPAGEPAADAVWLMAHEQTAGRGRRGKAWAAMTGGALTASFARDLPAGFSAGMATVPLVTAIVIAEHLDAQGLAVGIKWPNDLCVVRPDEGQPFAKVGGILCEMRSHGRGARLVIGCGLNVRAFPPELKSDLPAAALYGEQAPVDIQSLAMALGEAVFQGSEQLLNEGFQPFMRRWHRFDLLAGWPVRIHRQDGYRDGVALGIDESGRLRTRFDDTPCEIVSLMAEQISVRPRR